jgi:hypothetical protein
MHDIIDMIIDRPLADAEDYGDVPGTLAALQPLEDFRFP